jgi:hypothetical protein
MILDILNTYEPISLEDMSSIRLMNRTDTKFVTSADKLQKLLRLAVWDYRIQEIEGERISPYYTLYFDTLDKKMYARQLSGHANRQKLRIRSYVHSGLNFLEVKTKDNHGMTSKKRMTMYDFNPEHPDHDIVFRGQSSYFKEYENFLQNNLYYQPIDLREQLENRFNRITLVNKLKTERLTIDMDLRFHNLTTDVIMALPQVVILEIKRDGLQPSPILKYLKELRIKSMGFSKYCLGSAFTNDYLKVNNVKPRLHKVAKLTQIITYNRSSYGNF